MKLYIRPVFWGYLAAIAILSSPAACMGMLCALCVHEMSHWIVIYMLNEPIERIEIAPFGGVMTYQQLAVPSKGAKGAMLALSGPLGNYAAILLLDLMPKALYSEWIRAAMNANLAMLLLNLLPVFPLDGGMAVFSIGYYVFRISVLIQFLSYLGIIIGSAGFLLFFYGLQRTGTVNLSLLVVCCYLMHTARTHKMQMMTQNWYTIFRESQTYGGFAKHVQAYCIDGECSVLEALQFLRSSKRTFFFVEKENGTIECFTDRMLYEVMHENPAAVIADILKNKQKKNTLMP